MLSKFGENLLFLLDAMLWCLHVKLQEGIIYIGQLHPKRHLWSEKILSHQPDQSLKVEANKNVSQTKKKRWMCLFFPARRNQRTKQQETKVV